ncbi:MAG: hypothetical protein M1819_003839 [Sarea resinae]|nr:MAG: hypothetical protein M1819_003839 [Sarea resinae]
MTEISLAGKTCIITGAAGGLGRAIAETFLKAGANVVGCDINLSLLEATAQEISPLGNFEGVQTDITSAESLSVLFDKAIRRFGRLDVLVNNAGIMDRFDPVGDLEKDLWDRVIAVNLTAPYLTSKLAVNHFLSHETGKGVILNIGSASGLCGFRAGAAYTASKHGLVGLTKNTASFYGKRGIRCNAILPGAMETNVGDAFKSGMNGEGLALLEQQMKGTPPEKCELSDVSNLCLFLCSDASAALNGVCAPADRGWTSI